MWKSIRRDSEIVLKTFKTLFFYLLCCWWWSVSGGERCQFSAILYILNISFIEQTKQKKLKKMFFYFLLCRHWILQFIWRLALAFKITFSLSHYPVSSVVSSIWNENKCNLRVKSGGGGPGLLVSGDVIRVRRPDDDKCGGLSLASDYNHSTVQPFNNSTVQLLHISELFKHKVISKESVETVLFNES